MSQNARMGEAEKERRWGVERKGGSTQQLFQFGHVEISISVRHPSGYSKQTITICI